MTSNSKCSTCRTRDRYSTCSYCKICLKSRYKHICKRCGVSFSSGSSKAIVCGRECQRLRKIELNNIEYICKHCNTTFVANKHYGTSGRGKYCSVACFNEHQSKGESLKSRIEVYWNSGDSCHKIAANLSMSPHTIKRYLVRWGMFEIRRPDKRAMSLYQTQSPKNELKKGENSRLWKGGVTKENNRIRSTPEYKIWRLDVMRRDNYTCVFCNTRGGTLHADHIKPFAYFPELRFDLDNGRTLCVPCHEKTDTYKGKAKNYAILASNM